MLTSPVFAAFTFVGTGSTPQEAVATVDRSVSAFLATHQWRDMGGRTAYTITTTVALGSDGRFCVIITLIGPREET